MAETGNNTSCRTVMWFKQDNLCKPLKRGWAWSKLIINYQLFKFHIHFSGTHFQLWSLPLTQVHLCISCIVLWHSFVHIVVVQSLSHVRLFATPWTAARQASLSFATISLSLLKFMSIKLVMPSNHLILCCPLLLLSSLFPIIRVLSSESALCIRWPKYWSCSISPSNEYSGMISFRIDWFDLLTVQGTLKSLLQHDSSEASVLQYSAFFMVQLSHHTWLLGKP